MRFRFFVRDSDETPKLNLTSEFVLPTPVFKAFGRSNVMVNTRECHAKPKMKSVWSSRKEMRNQKLETRIKAKLFKMEAPNYGEKQLIYFRPEGLYPERLLLVDVPVRDQGDVCWKNCSGS